MMRHAGFLAILIFVILPASRMALAQGVTFRDVDVAQLAAVISSEARKSNQMPSGFSFNYSDGKTVLITTANAFELLARAIEGWQRSPQNPNGNFPSTVALSMPDLLGPKQDPTIEPDRDGLVVALSTRELAEKTPSWLAFAASQNNTLMRALLFGRTKTTSFRLSAAQFMVAMAVLIDESVKRKTEVPAAIEVPLVRSPREWNSTRLPIMVRITRTPPAPTVIPMSLRVLVNGVDPSTQEPAIGIPAPALPAYCGTIRVEVTGFGPVDKIRVMVNKTTIDILTGPGPHLLKLNTLPFADETHTLAVTAIDAEKKSMAYIFSFPIRNGRVSELNPLERDVEVTPIPE